MRTYQPIWEKLKTDKIVRIQASPEVHRRIAKAVRKEKTLDLAYRLENPPETCTEQLVWESSGVILTFSLKYKPIADRRLVKLSNNFL